MNSVPEHSLAAQIVVFVACGFIVSGNLILLYQWRTFLRWSVELLRPVVGCALILVGVAIRDTFYLAESVARKGKSIGSRVNYLGIDYRYGRSAGGVS